MRTISKRSIYIMMSVFFFSTLMGCNPSETKENLVDPSPTEDNPIYQTSPSPSPSQTHPTRTPDLYRPDTVRETLAAEATQAAAQLTHTALPTVPPLPTETPIPAGSFRLPPECEPFPDEVNIVNDDLWVRCGTEYPTLPW